MNDRSGALGGPRLLSSLAGFLAKNRANNPATPKSQGSNRNGIPGLTAMAVAPGGAGKAVTTNRQEKA
jgi:hypothetical protein